MSEEDLKKLAQSLHSNLTYYLRPYFLSITLEKFYKEYYIHIVISCPRFEFLPMEDRISYVFSLIKKYNGDILEKVSVIVEPFTTEEMSQYLETLDQV